MLDKLKGLWSKWKVQVTLVGGVLVIATVFGTCSYEPPEAPDEEVPVVTPASNSTEATATEATATEATATEATATEATATE
jgi:hypothetical protein